MPPPIIESAPVTEAEAPPPAEVAARIAVWPVIAAQAPDESSWSRAQVKRAVLLAQDPRVARIARAVGSRWRHPDPEILHADIVVRVARSNQVKFDEDNFLGYTKTVAERLCIDSFRHRNSQKEPPTAPLETISESDNRWNVRIRENVKIDSHEDDIIRRSLLAPLLEGLSTEHRQIIDLVYFEGLEVPRAALRLGIPLGTAKSRIWHGLRHMKKMAEAQNLTLNDFLSPY